MSLSRNFKSPFASSSTMPPPPPKLYVLVVDDDVNARARTEALFTRAGCIVTALGTCEKALKLMKVDYDDIINSNSQESILKVDLILVDYFMVSVPGMTGYMMLTAIKNLAMKDVPVVMLSSQPGRDREIAEKCGEDGCVAFLYKPMCLEDALKLRQDTLKKIKGAKIIDMKSDAPEVGRTVNKRRA